MSGWAEGVRFSVGTVDGMLAGAVVTRGRAVVGQAGPPLRRRRLVLAIRTGNKRPVSYWWCVQAKGGGASRMSRNMSIATLLDSTVLYSEQSAA